MITSTSDLIENLNVTKTLYSKFDKDAEENISQHLINEALADVYNLGNKVVTGFVSLHYLLGWIFVSFLNNKAWLMYAISGSSLLFIFLISVFFYPRKFITRVLSGIILLSYVLVYIQILNGLPELRFFIFTTFTILIVYQDWRALWPTALFLFIQIAAFIYLGSSFNFINAEYKELVLRLVSEDPLSVEFYIGIACFQVALAGIWAHFLRQQTISEVITKESLLLKQIQIEESNSRLEENVKAKTRELQEALELSQSGEEELRQNMEELKATQEEMEYQKQMLLENQDKMQKVEQELRERQSKMERSQWLESNLSRFDDIMRLNYDKDIEAFADIIMLNLAELLQATQGAFYIFNEEEDGLNMIGGYACTPDTVKKSKFRAGEGILGQILKTKKRVFLEDIPTDSAVIESALTKVKSKSILIEPLMYNSDIQGVIEVGLLEGANELHLEFMQRLARNIASMLQSIRGIMRTQRLLMQSQEITSQLQSNARELEKTKQEVEEKALEFKSQFKAIDRSMLVIECTTDGDVLRANDNFLQLADYSASELERKHHSIFLSEEFTQSEEYHNIWQSVYQDEYANSEFKCYSKSGSEFWIKAYYYSLGVGVKKKVMILAYDTTLQKEQDRQIRESLKVVQEKELMMRKNLEVMKELREEVGRKARELEEQMNAINVSTALVEYDGNGFIQYVNDCFIALLGYDRGDLMGQAHKKLVKSKLAESRSYQKFWEKLRKKEFIEGEFEFVAQDGRLVWLRGSYYPICDQDGKLMKVMQLATDISNEIQQEERIKDYLINLEKNQTRLKNETQLLRSQLEAISEASNLIELDPNGNIIRVNKGFLSLTNYEEPDLIGRHHRILVPKKYSNTKAYKELWQQLGDHKLVEDKFVALKKDKSEIKMKGVYFPVFDEESGLDKIIALISQETSQDN